MLSLYAWIQHPSYSGRNPLILCNGGLVLQDCALLKGIEAEEEAGRYRQKEHVKEVNDTDRERSTDQAYVKRAKGENALGR